MNSELTLTLSPTPVPTLKDFVDGFYSLFSSRGLVIKEMDRTGVKEQAVTLMPAIPFSRDNLEIIGDINQLFCSHPIISRQFAQRLEVLLSLDDLNDENIFLNKASFIALFDFLSCNQSLMQKIDFSLFLSSEGNAVLQHIDLEGNILIYLCFLDDYNISYIISEQNTIFSRVSKKSNKVEFVEDLKRTSFYEE